MAPASQLVLTATSSTQRWAFPCSLHGHPVTLRLKAPGIIAVLKMIVVKTVGIVIIMVMIVIIVILRLKAPIVDAPKFIIPFSFAASHCCRIGRKVFSYLLGLMKALLSSPHACKSLGALSFEPQV